MDLLQASGVVKKYANHLALDNINISVPENKIFGLLGPNGAGKTTFIRIINHITMPDAGEILFKGKPLKASDISKIGYLPEERGLYKKMKVGEQAIYLARLKGLSKRDTQQRLKYWFDKFEISPWWNKNVEELSKGMQQKVQFIITVLHEPELLIFDEPFSGFDPINSNLLKKEILALKDNGANIIFSTHNMSSVEEVCDEICLINNAKIILNGTIGNIKQDFKENRLDITFSGDADSFKDNIKNKCSIESLNTEQGTHHALLIPNRDVDNNYIITGMLNDFKIHSFSEVLPSMDEVFIKAVKNANDE